jgi:ribosomal protein L11 methyltransferase
MTRIYHVIKIAVNPPKAAIWAELSIDAPEDASETVAAYAALRGDGVEIRDHDTLCSAAAGRVQILAYVAPEQAEARVAELSGRFPGLAITVRVRAEEEWRDVWKQYFRPRRIGNFVVKPSWESFVANAGELVLELDPGRAFGTGNHESTQLVLEALPDLPAPRRFLDLGTGSGILALAACALWPNARGLAVDNDPDAVACAQENLARNHAAERVEVSAQPLAELAHPFDLILANLTAEILTPLADALAARLAPGGALVLSGILTEQAGAVAERFSSAGMRVLRALDRGEWRALVLARAP